MILVYDSSQSAILSLGENSGQLRTGRGAAAGGRVPRPAEVSKLIQASVMPSVSAGSSPSVTAQPVGCPRDSVASSMRVISARPSKVLKFQVKEMRSRQKQSSVNSAAALAGSF